MYGAVIKDIFRLTKRHGAVWKSFIKLEAKTYTILNYIMQYLS